MIAIGLGNREGTIVQADNGAEAVVARRGEGYTVTIDAPGYTQVEDYETYGEALRFATHAMSEEEGPDED